VTGSTPADRAGKYALVERERRFLLATAPETANLQAVRRITDRYLTGTRMRLRRVDGPGPARCEFKLTQKVPAERLGPVQGTITNIYLSEAEYDVFAVLPARVLTKTRLSIPPLGVDVFDAPLHGLVLAEAEFATDDDMYAFEPPSDVVAEVTDDPRFTGGRLSQAARADLLSWLGDYGVTPDPGRREP
jgi:CYTH domain-containing protein